MARAYYPCARCGDDQTIFGRTRKEADRKAEWAEQKGLECSECCKITALEEAEAFSVENELPELEGSEKQVQWANQIRQSIISQLLTASETCARQERPAIERTISLVSELTSARWFIDNRGRRTESYVDLLRPAPEPPPMPEALAHDLILQPPSGSGVLARIAISERPEHSVVLVSTLSYSEPLKEALRGAGRFQWSGVKRAWHLACDDTMGSVDDRVVETAVYLLGAGFSVELSDESLKPRIEASDYETRHEKWIIAGERFIVKMPYKCEDFDIARSLPGARYDSSIYSITVPLDAVDAVLDFAEAHGYRQTPETQSIIDAQLASRRVEILEDIPKRKKRKKKTKPVKQPITGVIDESLRDDN